ncbi:hypothetical protein Mapa_002612 [Marchantia paleacea]|nr:hypothetical protein Mapa_002612 [Marchantia paleacea]
MGKRNWTVFWLQLACRLTFKEMELGDTDMAGFSRRVCCFTISIATVREVLDINLLGGLEEDPYLTGYWTNCRWQKRGELTPHMFQDRLHALVRGLHLR